MQTRSFRGVVSKIVKQTPQKQNRRCKMATSGDMNRGSTTLDAPIVSSSFFLDEFADKLWEESNLQISKQAFVDKIAYEHETNAVQLQDGYAPFCKHLFVPNFTGTKSEMLKIKDDNKHLLNSDYIARREGELPVLARWFPQDRVDAPVAAYLDVILYSHSQIQAERDAKRERSPPTRALPDPTVQWGIISVKFQDVPYELPMEPITMLRNALGKEEGGSGVPLDRVQYDEAVAFWREHARIG